MSLIVPSHVAEGLRPKYECTCCGLEFLEEEEARWVRHVRDCSERNSDQFEEEIAEVEGDLFRSPADTELYEHIRKGGN